MISSNAVQLLEPFHGRLLSLHIRLRDGEPGGLRGRVQAIVVALLLALPPLNDELRGSLIGCAAKFRIGLRLLNRRLQLNKLPLGLFELLIEIGGGDRRQDLTFRHMSANILMPRGDVAAGAGEERTGVERGDVAWKNQLLFRRTPLGPHDAHRRNGLGIGPGRDLLSALGAVHDAGDGEADRADREHADDKQDATRFGFRWSGGRFRGHESSGSGVRGKPDEGLRRIGFGFVRIGPVCD